MPACQRFCGTLNITPIRRILRSGAARMRGERQSCPFGDSDPRLSSKPGQHIRDRRDGRPFLSARRPARPAAAIPP
jgi:hypothetical protein